MFRYNVVLDAMVSKHSLPDQKEYEPDALRVVDCKVTFSWEPIETNMHKW